MKPLTEVEQRLLAHWAGLSPLFGMSSPAVTIISLMALRPQPMTVDDLSELLSLSRSALVPALCEAQQVNGLRVTPQPDSKKLFYDLPFHGAHHGAEWFQWRTLRRLTMLIDPSIEILEWALKQPVGLEPITRERMKEVLVTFKKQVAVLHAALSLPSERLDDLMDKIVELSAEETGLLNKSKKEKKIT